MKPKLYTEYISQRIKTRRIQLNMRQQDLARKTELTQAQISKYERGENNPSVRMLFKLAKALHTSPDYLMGLTDESVLHEPVSDEEALALFRQFPPRKQAELLARLRFELELMNSSLNIGNN